jgi:hypothetical protein
VTTDRDGVRSDAKEGPRPWDDVLTTSMLGTARRDPPRVGGLVGDLVDDATPSSPSARLLTLVSALTVVRRVAFVPGGPVVVGPGPPIDPRPCCPPSATARWRHLVSSWPLLEDEWTSALLAGGWRAAPDHVPDLLRRHRRDPVRLGRALAAAGPLGRWLGEQCPELAPACVPAAPTSELLRWLPELPIPESMRWSSDDGAAAVIETIGAGLDRAQFGAPHRAVLVNTVARVPTDALEGLVRRLDAVSGASADHAIAQQLADLARTRRAMLAELAAAT